MEEKPDFSSVARFYSFSRPTYPDGLFDWLASIVERHEVAWDTATGNGQAALGLARHFRRVVATDLSEQQILNAKAHPNIEYRVAVAESSGLPDGSVDLITVASALHWFSLDAYYAEVQRVARPGAVLAAWTYHVAHAEPPFDAVLGPFYEHVAQYFAPGACLVDDRYAAILLPGTPIDAPSFTVSVSWTGLEFLRFVQTWSGVQAFRKQTGVDPVHLLVPSIEEIWDAPGVRHELRWPLYLRASRLDG